MSNRMTMTNNPTHGITVAELSYLVYFLVLFGGKAFGLSDGMPVYPATLYLGLFLFLIKVLLTEHTLFEYLWMGVFLTLALIVYANTGEKGLLLYFTMMLGVKAVDLRNVLKTGLTVAIAGFVILSFLSVFGIIEDRMFPQTKALVGFMLRRELGYPGMNVAHSAFFVIIVVVLLLQADRRNIDWKRLTLILFGSNVFVFLYTGSFTGVIATTVVLFVNLHFRRKGHITGIDYLWMGGLLGVMILYTFVFPFIIHGDLFWKLDDIFNNRFEYPQYFFTHEKITPFGSRFGQAPSADYYLDNAFQYAFLQLGVIPFFVLIFLLAALVRHCFKHDDGTLLSVVIAYCVIGMSDPLLFNLGYKNLLFLYIGSLLYQQSEIVEYRLPIALRHKFRVLLRGEKMITLPGASIVEAIRAAWCDYRKVILCSGTVVAIAVGAITVIAGSATTQDVFRDMAFLEVVREKYPTLVGDASIGWYLVYVRNALLCGIYAALIATGVLTCYTHKELNAG